MCSLDIVCYYVNGSAVLGSKPLGNCLEVSNAKPMFLIKKHKYRTLGGLTCFNVLCQ